MHLSLASDEFGRLTCLITNGPEKGIATSSDVPRAASGLLEALESIEKSGLGECFWIEGGGEYRWVFRRDGDRVRVALMWSSGTMTGWEHVFWGECLLDDLARNVREQLASVSVAPRATAG